MSRILIKAFGKKDIGKLVRKKVMDKNGKWMYVWVKPGKPPITERGKKDKPPKLAKITDKDYETPVDEAEIEDAYQPIRKGNVRLNMEKFDMSHFTQDELESGSADEHLRGLISEYRDTIIQELEPKYGKIVQWGRNGKKCLNDF